MSGALWYYSHNDEPAGPLSLEELVQVLTRQAASQDVLVWTEGWSNWARAGDVPVLNLRLVRPPPLPSKRQPVAPPAPEKRQEPAREGGKDWKGKLLGLIAAGVGLVLSREMGSSFWLPLLCIFGVYLGLSRAKVSAWTIPMLSVLLGHTVWIGIGFVTLAILGKPSDDGGMFLIELTATAALAFWSLKRPFLASSLTIFIYEIICFGSTLVEFENISRTSPIAAFVHLFLRLLGAGLAVYAAVKRRKFRGSNDADGPGSVAPQPGLIKEMRNGQPGRS